MADKNADASADASAQPVVPFKKRAKRGRKSKTKKKKNLKLPEAVAAGIDDEDDDLTTLLNDVRTEQKSRSRAKGLKTKSYEAQPQSDSDDEDADGYDPDQGGIVPKDKLALLDASYTGATKRLSDNENPHLLKYLAEKLGTNKKKDTSKQGQSSSSKLYELPDNLLKLRTQKQGKEVAEDQQALGGAVAFGTGIAEVELPIDYQLDNIEQTELAKAEFIKRQNNRKFNHRNDLDEMDSHGTGGNFGSNFRQHNREFKKRKREEFRRLEGRPNPSDANVICHTCNKPGHRSSNCPQGGPRQPRDGGAPRVQMASDDIMMRRFWARMRNQRRM